MLEKIKKDMQKALKERDKTTLSTLRLLLAEVHNEELRLRRELTEEEIWTLIQRGIKRRKESIEQFDKGGRQDLVDKEEGEAAVLKKYLPPPLSEKELAKIVADIIAELEVKEKKEMGKVMREVMERYKGRVEGSMAQRVVLSKLK
ncbi:MAG: GatB/YqeY domain-containing protein [Candidatus Aminicenantes bacterium]|nr:GatB/YqeY domain-containing protein [Candidatus Aminicenantes bacterium]